jgi:hypothetical protein
MISRRQMLSLAAAAAVGSLIPSSVRALTLPQARLPLLEPSWQLNMCNVVQELDCFLIDAPTIRELQRCYSGPKVFPCVVLDGGAPQSFFEKNDLFEYVERLKGKYISAYGSMSIPDRLGSILRKHGGEPDWDATEILRKPYYEWQMDRFAEPKPPGTICPVCGSEDYEDVKFHPLRKCANRICGVLWMTNENDYRNSDWPIPLVVTKCGVVLFWHEDKWVWGKAFDCMNTGGAAKYQFGPPEDASWVDKVYYGGTVERFQISNSEVQGSNGQFFRKSALTRLRIQIMEESGADMAALYAFTSSAPQVGVFMNLPSRHGTFHVARYA